jgi:protein-disulfide isomerase
MPKILRLAALAALAALALGLGLGAARDLLRPGPHLAFVDRAEPGFRDLVLAEAEPASAGASRGAALTPADPGPAPAPVADICAALFEDPDDPRIGDGAPVAVYFTDYRCPYCRVLGALLLDRAEAGEITLIVKEWPILGPASETAARVALAAARQDRWLPIHERLMHSSFQPTPAYVAGMAEDIDLDLARLDADLADPAIEAHLERTAALATALGIRGTPGLVVGRTVAKRSVREARLDRLIEAERALGPAPC